MWLYQISRPAKKRNALTAAIGKRGKTSQNKQGNMLRLFRKLFYYLWEYFSSTKFVVFWFSPNEIGDGIASVFLLLWAFPMQVSPLQLCIGCTLVSRGRKPTILFNSLTHRLFCTLSFQFEREKPIPTPVELYM